MMTQYRNIWVLLGMVSFFVVLYGFVIRGSEQRVTQFPVLLASQGRPEGVSLKPCFTRQAETAARHLMQIMAANEGQDSQQQVRRKIPSRIDSKKGAYKCYLCGAVFQSRSDFSGHWKGGHAVDSRFACPRAGCVVVCSDSRQLGLHKAAVHDACRFDGDRRIYRCPSWKKGCRYWSLIKANVNRHSRRHQKRRGSVLCGHPGCWKPFDTAKQLKAHVLSHHSLQIAQ